MIEAFLDLREIHSVFERARDVLENAIGVPVCSPNCGRCCECHIPNSMTIEAMYACSILTGNGKLKKAVSIAEGWLLDKHPSATIHEGMPQGFLSHKLREEAMAVKRSQCPFLENDKRCGIYEVRPLACRAYGVTRDASEECPRPLGTGEHMTQRIYIPAEDLRNRINILREQWKDIKHAWIVGGLVPTVLYRAAEPKKFKKMVLDNRVASAKIIGVDYETSIMWQYQVDTVRSGVSPDVASVMSGKAKSPLYAATY